MSQESPAPQGPRALVSTLCILALIAGSLVWAVLHQPWARHGAAAALLLYVVLEIPRMAWGARRILLVAAAASVAAVIRLPDPASVLARALSEAAFMVGLFAALGMLRDTAETSPLVRDCGESMVRQPPGRRYVVLSLGSHIISLALNFGVLPLLGTMVNRGNTLEAAKGETLVQDVRKRRMMTAILRGFAMMTVWSPLSISFAVTQGSMHGIDWWHLLALQLVLALLLMGLGWGLDRLGVPKRAPGSAPLEFPGGDWGPILRLCLFIAAIVAAAVAVAALLGTRMVMGAILVVPLSALGWAMAQGGMGAAAGFAQRLTVTLPAFRYEAAVLGGSMYVGIVVSAFVSPDMVAAFVKGLPLPPILLLIAMAWSVMILAQLGVSQIITVSLLGGAAANLGEAGINPLVLASGLMGAWGLSACSTLAGAAVLTVAKLAEVPAGQVARNWNGIFVVTGALLLAAWMALLSMVLQ